MTKARSVSIAKSARYFVSAPEAEDPAEVWFVLHGYGQLAETFLEEFSHVADEDRLVVAPEGLSRFYLQEGTGPVGASWMTRVDRDGEIADYVRYLDAVYAQLLGDASPRARIHVLGFSQGTATAARWAALGAARVDRLTLWGGGVPPDLGLERYGEALGGMDLTFVVGSRDEFIDAEHVEQEALRLRDAGVAHRLVTFDGGHRMDRKTLERLG